MSWFRKILNRFQQPKQAVAKKDDVANSPAEDLSIPEEFKFACPPRIIEGIKAWERTEANRTTYDPGEYHL